jgi:putative ABC transport system substrate-binding protein
MRRREFITLIGGTASALFRPWAAQSQPRDRVRRVGVLMGLAAGDAESQARLAAFAQGLQQMGWTVGQNLRIDYRWGAGNTDAMRKHAADLVALAPEVILAHSSAALAPLLQASRTIPIVFTIVADPVGAGFVGSMPHPGGNATGFTNFEYGMAGKWLELLKEITPRVTRVFLALALVLVRGGLLGRLLAALPARLRQQIERALDAGDHAGGDPRVARRRIQFVVSQQSRVIMHLGLTH